MECRTFEVTLISASDLPHVRRLLQMKVYAEVSIQGRSNSESKFTPTDEDREANPYWNFKIDFDVPEKAFQLEDSILLIKLYSKRSLKRDKYVGQVNLSLKKLFDSGLEKEGKEFNVDCNGAKDGFPKLILSYKFGTTVKIVDPEEKSKKKPGYDYEKLGAQAAVVGAIVGFGALVVAL